MSTPSSRGISRRAFLASAATLAAAVAAGGIAPPVRAQPGRAVRTLVHDEVQEGAAFGRGRRLGAELRSGALRGEGVFESEVIASPFPFTHLGLHWRARAAGGQPAAFDARTSADGTVWSEWRSPHIEAGPDETPSAETYASLVGAPRHRFAQYRTFLAAGAEIDRVTATFLNSRDGPDAEVIALATLPKPAAIDFSRADWGCDEGLRFDRRGREVWPRMFVPVKKLVVHHTAGRNDYAAEEAAAEVRAVYTYHAVTLGWGDIGYSALVDRFGRSYEGRYGRELSAGREVFSLDVVAGHAYAHNYGSTGVSLIGNFEEPVNVQIADPMVRRLLDVLEYAGRMRQLDPRVSSDFLLSDGTWKRGLANVCGHRDCLSTLCPGQNVYDLLPEIRAALHERLSMAASPAFVAGAEGGPDGTQQSSGSLTYRWQPSAATYDYYLEGWYKSSNSEAIGYLSGFDADRYPAWRTTSATQVSFSGLKDGHYTLHLRTGGYQADRTVLLGGVSPGGGKKPPRR